MISRKSAAVALSFFLALLVPLASCAGPEGQDGFKEPIYTFDFRDVFYDIASLDKDRAVISGLRGRILVSHSRYNNLWSPRESGTTEALTSLSFIDNKNGWAAGHGGVVIKTTDGGDTWAVQREPAKLNQPILDLQFVTAGTGYACGAYDTFLKTTDGGETWQCLSTGIDIIYNTLLFLSVNEGYLAGEFGTIIKTTDGGKSWKKVDTNGFRGTFNGINITPSGKLIAYGMRGKIITSSNGGRTWKDVNSGVTEPLFRAAFYKNDIAIVGRTGVILLSSNDGESFTLKQEEEFTTFSGVCARPGGEFICVGEMGKIYKAEAKAL